MSRAIVKKMGKGKQTIVIIGAGGLGTPAALSLAQSVESSRPLALRLVDPDIVELSNLNRQFLYTPADIGLPKVHVLAKRLEQFQTDKCLNIESISEALSIKNIETILQESSFVIEASDSPYIKFLVNDFCIANKISFCFAGVSGTTGLLIPVVPSETACLRCIFGDIEENNFSAGLGNCSEAGITGASSAYLGFAQAHLARQFIAGNQNNHMQNPFMYRLASDKGEFTQSSTQIDPRCPISCHTKNIKILDLRDKKCPETFLFTKLALEQSHAEYALDVRFSSCEYTDKVILTCEKEGHKIYQYPRQIGEHSWRILIKSRNGTFIRQSHL